MDFEIQNGVLSKYTGKGGLVVIPSGVTAIGRGAFQDRMDLREIRIPDSIRSIGAHAFAGCWNLEQLTLPEGLEQIDRYAFLDCKALRLLIIPGTVACIEDAAFSGCESLMAVTLSPGVTHIGTWAFQSCRRLITLSLPDTLVSIGVSAFSGCEWLTSVAVPQSVTHIGYSAFSNCRRLRELSIPEGFAIPDYSWANLLCDRTPLEILRFPGAHPAKLGALADAAILGHVLLVAAGIPAEPELDHAYQEMISLRRKRLYPTIFSRPELLRYMTARRLIPLSDLEMLLDQAQEHPDLKAELLEYIHTAFPPEQRDPSTGWNL